MSAKSNKQAINSNVWILLVATWVAIAASQIITFGYGMMMPGVMQELNVSTDTMGRIGGVASWVGVFLTIPGALIAVKFNPKYSVPFTVLGMALGLFLFGRALNIPMMYFSRIIAGAFAQLIATCLVGTKILGVPPQRMTQINGIENFVGPIGQVVATLFMAPVLILLGSWRNVYVMIAIIMAALAVLYFFMWGNGKNITYGQPAAQTAAEKQGTFAALKEAWSNKVVWLQSLAWPGTTIVWIAMFYFWPTYATSELGIDLAQAGVVLSMIPIFSAIASLTSPILANKLGYDKPLIWSWGIILPICYFMMTQISNIALLCVFSAIAGYGAYCFVPLAFTNVYKLGLSRSAVTLATGTILTFVGLGSAIAGTVVGMLTVTFGLKNALAISCLTPVWFGVLMLFVPELGRKKMEKLAAEAKSTS